MGLFKAKTADELEEKLMKVVNGFSQKLGLRDEVTTKMENADNHIKVGLVGGLGIGALGLVGGVASIPLIPAIATTTVVAGFTVAGAAMAAGGAATVIGLGYAGLGKLYSKYQESRLGSLTSRAFESHRKEMIEHDFTSDLSEKFHKQTDYKNYAKNIDLYSIMQAVKQGDMNQAKNLVKEMVATTDLPENNKKSLFKAPIADDMNQKLGKFFDEYRNKEMGIDNQNAIMKRDTKMGIGMLAAMGAAMGSAAAIVTLSSPAIIGGALALSVAAMGYSAIQKIAKTGLEQRNSTGFKLDASAHIHNVARDLNISYDDLKSIKSITENKNASISEMKEKFITETSNRIKNKIT